MSSHWIMPFTGGCFVYVALVSLGPDLMAPHHAVHYMLDMLMVVLGIAMVTLVRDA